MARRFRIFLWVATITLALDQLSKWLARARLDFGRPHQVIAGFFDLRLSYNTGSAFGLFAKLGGARVLLSVVGLAACVAIVLILRKAHDAQRWLATALALVAGGAVGNVIDRVLAGKVTDFIVWKYGKHEWPAFNIADAALVAGVLIMFFDVGRDSKKKAPAPAETGKAAGKEPKRRG